VDELTILVWTFVVISVIEFFIIIILKSMINYYQEEENRVWNLYTKEARVVEFLKEKLFKEYDKKIEKILEKSK